MKSELNDRKSLCDLNCSAHLQGKHALLIAYLICTFLFGCGESGKESKLVLGVDNRGVQLGASEQLHARLVRGDGSTQDVTNSVNWSSSAPDIIQISSSGVVRPVATGKSTVRADFAGVSANADLTATKLFGVTQCCPNNFVILAPSAGTSLPPLPVGDMATLFYSTSATDPVNHRFYVFSIQNNTPFLTVIDTTTAKLISTRPLSVTVFDPQWDQQSGNILAITVCCPNQLVSINPVSGYSTPIAVVGDMTVGFYATSALDQVNHRLYFIRTNPSNAVSLIGVDTFTGSIAVQFPLHGPLPFLITWDANTGNLLGLAYGNNSPSATIVVLLDTKTGAETSLGGGFAPPDLQGWTTLYAMDSVRNRFYAVYVDLGNGGPAKDALLSNPVGITVDPSGNLYIADTKENRIRMVDTDGVITTFAGNGNIGFAGDRGSAVTASLHFPMGVVIDGNANLYIADTANDRIREVDATGTITTFAGNGTPDYGGDGGPAVNAGLNGPKGSAFDTAGNLYIADTYNNRIRKVDASGVITTFAGNGTAAFAGDGGPALNASLSAPSSIALDALRNLYIADTGNHRIRKVDPNGVITTFAGNGTAAFAGDGGPASNASLWTPTSVALDALGNFYIADTANNRIRKIDSNGVITTFAGNGTTDFSGDDGPASNASLNAPSGIAIDTIGNVFIADTYTDRIRKVDTNGVITTAAGVGGVVGFAPARKLIGIDTTSGAISESLRPPQGIILLGAE